MYGCDIHIIFLKNRSNIAASILLNGDILEQVRNASATEYMGSADQELDKYLDSIDGRINKLTNHLQELASVNIDNEWIKGAISLLDTLVQGVTKLTDALGGVQIVIGTIIGAIKTINGLGELHIAKERQLLRNRINIIPLFQSRSYMSP